MENLTRTMHPLVPTFIELSQLGRTPTYLYTNMYINFLRGLRDSVDPLGLNAKIPPPIDLPDVYIQNHPFAEDLVAALKITATLSPSGVSRAKDFLDLHAWAERILNAAHPSTYPGILGNQPTLCPETHVEAAHKVLYEIFCDSFEIITNPEWYKEDISHDPRRKFVVATLASFISLITFFDYQDSSDTEEASKKVVEVLANQLSSGEPPWNSLHADLLSFEKELKRLGFLPPHTNISAQIWYNTLLQKRLHPYNPFTRNLLIESPNATIRLEEAHYKVGERLRNNPLSLVYRGAYAPRPSLKDMAPEKPVHVMIVLPQYYEKAQEVEALYRHAEEISGRLHTALPADDLNRPDSQRLIPKVVHVGRTTLRRPCMIQSPIEARPLGDFSSMVARTPPAFLENLCYQLAKHLASFHAVGIAHRNLHGGNVLLSDTPDGKSFFLHVTEWEHGTTFTPSGKPSWPLIDIWNHGLYPRPVEFLAPELLPVIFPHLTANRHHQPEWKQEWDKNSLSQEDPFRSDVFYYGLMIFRLLTGRAYTFLSEDPATLKSWDKAKVAFKAYQSIIQTSRQPLEISLFKLLTQGRFSDSFNKFIQTCLEPNPLARFSNMTEGLKQFKRG